ncbi:MAG: autotransporter-associated beta strand repeat-containing protein [Thermoflexaceae bacterium]|nr:autotransporter-associated beta strand repeat-containing protein [Thermoflexaceae bacterium]
MSQYIYYLTYDFEQIGDTTKEMTVPKGAENLIKTRLPYLSDEERRYVLYTTGLKSGYPLLDDAEGWGRLNLYEAVHGYGALVKDTTVTMDASKGGYYAKDNWLNDIEGTGALTKEGTGELVLAGNNSYTGGTTVNSGTLTVTNSNGLGAGDVVNNSVLAEETSGAVQIKSNYAQKDGAKLVLNISGKESFSGCVNVKTIGKKAFYNCNKVSSVTISTKKLTSKTVGSSAFSKMGSVDYKKLKVKVPSAKLKGYKKLLTDKGLSTKATIKK